MSEAMLRTFRLMWEAMWEENLSKYVQDKDVLAATVQYFQQ